MKIHHYALLAIGSILLLGVEPSPASSVTNSSPAIAYARFNGSLSLSWPASFASWQLQSSPDALTWIPIATGLSSVSVPISVSTPSKYFRLSNGTAFSSNIVGYTNEPVDVNGSSLINPFYNPDSSINAIIPGVNDGSWDNSILVLANPPNDFAWYDSTFGGWANEGDDGPSSIILSQGTSFEFYPASSAITNLTFIGQTAPPSFIPLIVTWTNPAAITYGTPLSFSQLNASANVSGSFAYAPALGQTLDSGTKTLTAVFTPTDTSTYSITANTVSLVVQPAGLTVTANGASRPYAATNPIFTGVIIGALGSDTITAAYATTATPSSPAGTYAIVPSLMAPAGRLTNYLATTNLGTLTITRLSPVITWANPAPIGYGTPLGASQLNATATVPGAFSYNPAAPSVLNAGTTGLGTSFTPTDTTNYNSVSSGASLVVLRAPLTVSANNTSRSYGQTNPIFTGTFTGVTNGDPVTASYSCSAVSLSPPGQYPIVPSLNDPNGRLFNYSIATNNGTLTLTPGAPPTLVAIVPAKGPTNGGTLVTITGSNFELGAGVLLGGQPATGVAVNSATQITALTPPNLPGLVSVTMANPDATTATLANSYTYVGPSPTILVQPATLSVVLGSNAVFQVNALYAASYQWQFNGGNLADNGRITGTHGPVLTIPGAQTTDAGSYQVVMTNSYGATNSVVVTLSVVVPPTITTPPQSQAVGIGGTATFTVGVSGSLPFVYQWLKGSAPISGATNAVLTRVNVQTNDQAQYSVVVSNAANAAVSAPANLTVLNYCASAQASQSVYPVGSQVPLLVRTFNCSSQAAVANASATVFISTAGVTRSLPVTTGPSGSTMVNFTPLPSEAGTYQVAAVLPGQAVPAAQSTFSLVGMNVGAGIVSASLTPGVSITNTIVLSNLTSVALTGVSASILGSPADVQVQASTPATLAGNGTNLLSVVMLAPANAGAQDVFEVQLTTAQGTTNLLPVVATIVPTTPNLVATPSSLHAAMLQGGQTLVSFTVANMGGSASGPVEVLLPQAPWLSLVTAQPMPSLAPGQSNLVTVALTPAANLPLGPYSSGLVLAGSNTETSVPFTFNCVSTISGALQVTAQDELSYFGADSPNVSNATVVVTDFFTGTNVASAVTGASGGVLFSNLTAAYYNVAVSEPNHGSFDTTVQVLGSQTNVLVAFLPMDLVDYTWLVTPTIFPDHYEFTLNATFETEVPFPVVTITPGALDLCGLQGDTNQIYLTLTNSGIISAQGATLNFGSHPDWLIQPLASSLGDLLPHTNLVVPVTITRLGTSTGVPTDIDAWLNYHVDAVNGTFVRNVPFFVYDADPAECNPQSFTPIPSVPCVSCGFSGGGGGGGGGGIFIVGGGGGGGGGGFTVVSGGVGPAPIQQPSVSLQTPQSPIVTVTIQIDQRAAIARDAFKATLKLNNHAGTTISNLSATITVYDASNNVANSLFGIPAPMLTGLSAIDGTGAIANGAAGQIVWTVVPATNAAPLTATPYKIGGSFSYVLNGEPVTVPIFPTQVSVLPTPILSVDYFLQHDVYSDDPFTPQTEPSLPFPLAILVKNNGMGTAHDFTITSAQPEIIDNSNDLIIAFQLIASQLGTNPIPAPSMTMDFGVINPHGTVEGLWDMTSTLEGQFIGFSGVYQHIDDLGNTNTSLISSLRTHEMKHVVQLTGAVDDGLPDFLVNDTTNVDAPPGIVYSSAGLTYPVTSLSAANAATVGTPTTVDSNITLTITGVPAGYVYMEAVDPGNGVYPILSVKRSDGTNLLVGPNVWQTPQRLHMVPPQPNNLIHIFDHDSSGSYIVTYGLPITAPTAASGVATGVTPTNAILNAIVDPNGADTQVYFQWGATTNYGQATPTTTLTSGLYSAQAVQLGIGGLLPNTTNHFRVVAVNSAGTTFGVDVSFATLPLLPPMFTQVADRTIADGQKLLFTNHVVVATQPVKFSLGSSAPLGAAISTNGVFTWSPACEQGSSTNLITIWATDGSSPPLSNSMTFSVIVGECIQLSLSSAVVQVGQTGAVTVTLISSVGMTNLNWILVDSASRFTNWTFASSNGTIASATASTLDASSASFRLAAQPGQIFQSPSTLGTVNFLVTPGDSAIVAMYATNVSGSKVDGSLGGNISSSPCRVVVIGPQPLLDAGVGPNATRQLILYGNPGTNYQVLYSTNLLSTNWQSMGSMVQTNLADPFNANQTMPKIFYRAVKP